MLETSRDIAPAAVVSRRQGRVLPDPSQCLPVLEPPACLHAAFVAQAAAAPGRRALVWPGGGCTYAELDAASAALARTLVARGIGAGDTVAIFASRGPALVYSVLGVLRSGAAFHIVDASYPVPRMLACLAQTRPAALLVASEAALPERLAIAHGAGALRVPSAVGDVLALLQAEGAGMPLPEVDPDSVAYVTFTSGSTGVPKGVVTGHAPLPHFVRWQIEHGRLTEADRFSMLSGLGHDPVLRDIFTPLSLGATLHIPTQATLFDADALWQWFASEGITVAHMTPAFGEILLAGRPDAARLPALRRVYWGGDLLRPRLASQIAVAAPSVQQTNCYGATETPQVMAYFDLSLPLDAEQVPVGRGIEGAQLLVIDEHGGLCGPQQAGEIWIRSPYLSRGYLDDPEQTALRFVRNPLTDAPGDLCYRTGDQGRYRADGAVLYTGRADQQVKIRGFRVEPLEIARALEQQAQVARAIVLAPEVGGEKQLAAYVALQPGATAAPSALRRALEGELPSYMVPKYIFVLTSFPMLPNGKVDLRALPQPSDQPVAGDPTTRRLPRNEAERKLAAVWADILGIEQVGIDDSFLDLGGDSLSAIRALSRMRRLGISEDVARGIFQGRTIAELTGGSRSTGSATRPLVGTARTTLLINVLRGLLVCLLVVDHWRAGIFKRLLLPELLTSSIEFIFHLPTPGFAFVFGLGLGHTHYESFLRNPAAARRLLHGGALLLAAGTLLMGVSRNLGVLARGVPLDYDLAATNFFLPTLYYWLALATTPLWFALMARREGKRGGSLLACLLLAACCRGAYELARWLLLEHEQKGLLQLGRLMLTARFSYFNLSTGALLGIFFGLYLRRERGRPHLIPHLLGFGTATLGTGLAAYLLQQDRYPDGLTSADIWLPEWLFYLGITLLLGALVEAALLAARVVLLRRALEWVGTIGQCAMPIFILQGMVLDFTAFGRALGLSDALAVALALVGFTVLVGWMMRRIHGLYYGSVPSESEKPEAVPATA